MKELNLCISVTSPDDENFGSSAELEVRLKEPLEENGVEDLIDEIQSAVYRFLRERLPSAKIDT